MSGTTHAERLSVEQRLQLRQSAERLRQRFDGQLNAVTIERFLNDS